MALDNRDVSILTQVAFKAAIDKTTGDLLDPETASQFEAKILYLTETLVNAVEVSQGKYATANTAPARSGGGSSARTQSVNDGEWEIEVVTTQDGNGLNGPLPAWFVAEAKKKGVRKVYDNRHRLNENPKLPWFKATDADVPFWPPKGK